jgi:hypothetical protein
MKQYVGISRDHSGSMWPLQNRAKGDYNEIITALKNASEQHGADTIVSVVSHQGSIKHEVTNSSVNSLKPLTSYPTPGGSTPLFDSVKELIDVLSKVPNQSKTDVSFLVMAITDGYDNSSRIKGRELGQIIQKLQMTDRWTFVFRIPRGDRRSLEALGIPAGNIQEWDQTEYGFREATDQTLGAIRTYYGNVSRGIRSTQTFYADLGNVSHQQVLNSMEPVHNVRIEPVNYRTDIQSYVEQFTGRPYLKGTAFYQLTKTEKEVQDYKVIVIRNKNTGSVYGGSNARFLLNLPTTGTIRLAPGNHGEWDIFIQSTSTNRILLPGTSVLYWRQ